MPLWEDAAVEDVLDATSEPNCLFPATNAVEEALLPHIWTSWRMQGLAYWDAIVATNGRMEGYGVMALHVLAKEYPFDS